MKLRLLPQGATAATRILYCGRGLRAFGDGMISLVMPVYLTLLGFDAFAVGMVIAATLLGSGALTVAVGFTANRFGARNLLVLAALLMIGTGLGFMLEERFWPLLVIAFIGTLNPSAGDASLFLPLEQAVMSTSVPDESRTAAFAAYSLIAAAAGAAGSLAAGLPDLLVSVAPVSLFTAVQGMFAIYAVLGLATYHLYRRLPQHRADNGKGAARPLQSSRAIVFKLAALFSLDNFASGLMVQSLLALWLLKHFGLSLAAAGTIFFWTGAISACSFPVASLLARRIGLVNTMVFTHLPSNFLIIAVAFAPNLATAVTFLLLRSLLMQMDVPARTSYVMAVVRPMERPAAASVTAVPRSLASAGAGLISGWLATLSPFAWFLIAGGGLKIVYDLSLWALCRRHPPPEERV